MVTKLADVAAEEGGTAPQDIYGGPYQQTGMWSASNGPKIEWSAENASGRVGKRSRKPWMKPWPVRKRRSGTPR